MTTAQDAAVLYFALHGTDAPLTCWHLPDNHGPNWDTPCGKTMAGIDHADGFPLCADHVKSEGGHKLSEDTLAELWLIKRTLGDLKENTTPLSNLEAFALKVSGHYSEEKVPDSGVVTDTMPAPPLEDHQEEKPWENNYEPDNA